jgi:hypothetical protein
VGGIDDSADATRAVLGDELSQRGDPLGELIGLQRALDRLPPDASPIRRGAIERRVAAHLDQHHDAFYGELAPYVTRLSRPDLFDPALEIKEWRAGFADVVWIQSTLKAIDLVGVLRAMRELPIMRYVRRIEIGYGDHPAAIDALMEDPPPTLRELFVGSWSRTVPGIPNIALASPSPLAPIVGQLEALELTPLPYARLDAPEMRRLRLANSWPYGEPGPLFDWNAPRLETLECWGFQIDRELLDRYPTLYGVRLSYQFTPGWLEHVVRSPRFATMRWLDLNGGVGVGELEMLVANAHRLVHLERLDLRGNYLPPDAWIAAMPRLPPCVQYH